MNRSGWPSLSRSIIGAPADIPGLDTNSRRARDVVEVAGAVVVIEAVRIVGKVRLEEIEVSVQIVVPDSDAHSRLLAAVLTQRDAAQHTLFAKGAVVIVHEQQTRRRIAGH